MAIRLHTRVQEDLIKACTHDGVVDHEQLAEMKMESIEYANEVRGMYDEPIDPAEFDEDDIREEYDEDDEEV